MARIAINVKRKASVRCHVEHPKQFSHLNLLEDGLTEESFFGRGKPGSGDDVQSWGSRSSTEDEI